MQADAEHQQDDADLGELAGDRRVGDKAGRERTDEDAGDEIADQRRQPQPVGQIAEDRRQHEADSDRRNEIHVMWQGFDPEEVLPLLSVRTNSVNDFRAVDDQKRPEPTYRAENFLSNEPISRLR